MFERYVTRAALSLHLLVVLMMANGSYQLPSCLGGISEKELMKKLKGNPLKPDEVFALLNKVSGKSRLAIGETDVEELVKMNEIDSKRCYDDSLYLRKLVLKHASLAHIPNVDGYCEDRLDKLSKLCAERTDLPARGRFTKPPITEATVEYFRSLLKDYTPPRSHHEEYDFVDKYLGFNGYYWGQQLTEEGKRDYQIRSVKKEQLFDNCMVYFNNERQLAVDNQPQDGDPNRLNKYFNAPGWTRVKGLCWSYFSRYGLLDQLSKFWWLFQ